MPAVIAKNISMTIFVKISVQNYVPAHTFILLVVNVYMVQGNGSFYFNFVSFSPSNMSFGMAIL